MSIRIKFNAGDVAKASDVNSNTKHNLDLGKLFLYDKLGYTKYTIDTAPNSDTGENLFIKKADNTIYVNAFEVFNSDGVAGRWIHFGQGGILFSGSGYSSYIEIYYGSDDGKSYGVCNVDITGYITRFKWRYSVDTSGGGASDEAGIQIADGTSSDASADTIEDAGNDNLPANNQIITIDARDKSNVVIYQNGTQTNTFDCSSWSSINIRGFGNKSCTSGCNGISYIYTVEIFGDDANTYTYSATYTNKGQYYFTTNTDPVWELADDSIVEQDTDLIVSILGDATTDQESSTSWGDIIKSHTLPNNLMWFSLGFGSD